MTKHEQFNQSLLKTIEDLKNDNINVSKAIAISKVAHQINSNNNNAIKHEFIRNKERALEFFK